MVMLIQRPMIVWMIMLSQTIKRKTSITILFMIAANTNDNIHYIPIHVSTTDNTNPDINTKKNHLLNMLQW